MYEKQGPITLIGLNRPETRNAIDRQLTEELNSRITEFEDDKTATVGVLYGIGGSFCSGTDLREVDEEHGVQLKAEREVSLVVETGNVILILEFLEHFSLSLEGI